MTMMTATMRLVRLDRPSLTLTHSLSRTHNDDQWDVVRYRAQHSFVWKYGSSLLDLVDWEKRPITSILDVGCGSGELAHALHERAGQDCHVQGMDLDPDMVATAQTLHPHINFFVGDARSFQVAQPVDLVFSNAALHWVPPKDASKAAHALGRALKPEGQLVVEFGGKGNVYSIVHAVRRAMAARRQSSDAVPDDVDDFWYYPSIADFATELQVHGNIEVIQASLYDRPTPLDDGPYGMANWLRMFGSKFWEGATIAEQEQIIADACDLLRGDLYDATQQRWTADYRRIRLVGRKLP